MAQKKDIKTQMYEANARLIGELKELGVNTADMPIVNSAQDAVNLINRLADALARVNKVKRGDVVSNDESGLFGVPLVDPDEQADVLDESDS